MSHSSSIALDISCLVRGRGRRLLMRDLSNAHTFSMRLILGYECPIHERHLRCVWRCELEHYLEQHWHSDQDLDHRDHNHELLSNQNLPQDRSSVNPNVIRKNIK